MLEVAFRLPFYDNLMMLVLYSRTGLSRLGGQCESSLYSALWDSFVCRVKFLTRLDSCRHSARLRVRRNYLTAAPTPTKFAVEVLLSDGQVFLG